jgi:hypothetical protein
MSTSADEWGYCAAFGCPLLGSFGVGGKWYCCCHFRANPSSNDAITAAINRHSNLVQRALSARQTFAGYAEIKAAEDELVEITREIGRQSSIPTAPIIGPTHAMTHYAETGE